ncbi:ImmA/IrrE family metallo-endopeptidase [Flagellimonas olearia]|uniref:IrrE N-terminal-like domain-containing protein n=1 Tax=Flagellimonas olearia TaxID=552546 RepID=A0A444VLX1_9FLAO|nr:ImmA/IrrE family metallo-endopeptidase [Allomuricauda olearia]RYC51754.1 hypothetical protein DN53_13075 [Allomuricauda olearia]
MTRPEIEAKRLLDSLGWEKPGDLSLNQIGISLNAMIRDVEMKGSQGRILMKENYSVISVNSDISYNPKRNFVIAHEIGHLSLHKKIMPLFSDNKRTLNEWYSKGKHEEEANQFASELLMPTELFIRESNAKNKSFSFELIRELCDFFGASQTATLLKYCRIGNTPVSIVFSNKGVISWKVESKDFPLKFLKIGSKVQEGTSAYDFYQYGEIEQDPVEVAPMDWFPEDFQVEDFEDVDLMEQSIRIGEESLLTCLWF